MKVYVVGDDGPEHNTIKSIHRTYKGALKAWNEVRIKLKQEAQSFLKDETRNKEMWQRMIKNLSCKDPDKIDNYPHETPYITEYEVEE